MRTKLARKESFNGIRFSDIDELTSYLDNSHDAYVSSDRFAGMSSDSRELHVASYRGIREAIMELKSSDELNEKNNSLEAVNE